MHDNNILVVLFLSTASEIIGSENYDPGVDQDKFVMHQIGVSIKTVDMNESTVFETT